MIATVALNYDQITFTSTILDEALIGSMILNYTYNCGEVSDDIDITDFLEDIVDNTLTLDVTDIFPDNTVFDDGIYYFTITAGTAVGGDPAPTPGTYTLTSCIYIGTTTRCKAVCKYLAGGNDIIEDIIKALDHINECDDCGGCTNACILYDYLTTLLDTNSTSSNVYSDCGCN